MYRNERNPPEQFAVEVQKEHNTNINHVMFQPSYKAETEHEESQRG